MTTTNLNYKEVFQLAQDKGYKTGRDYQSVLALEESKRLSEIPKYVLLELTLIQKWLRDEHKIDIEVSNQFEHPGQGSWYSTKISFRNGRAGRKYIGTGINTPYEEALLNGINEALKLL